MAADKDWNCISIGVSLFIFHSFWAVLYWLAAFANVVVGYFYELLYFVFYGNVKEWRWKVKHLGLDPDARWYRVETNRLKPEYARLYVPMAPDEETDTFLETSTRLSNSIITQIYHSVAKFLLGFFMTQTSINGWLGRGSMFVFSKKQFARLTGKEEGSGGTMVDLGAGDGATTQMMSAFYNDVTVTEVSQPLRNVLAKAGFRVEEIDQWFSTQYDLVSCLNLLDRCERPKTLLGQMRAAMKPDGIAIVAVVLPFNPWVESGNQGDHMPVEDLPIKGNTFEEQVQSVIENVLLPSGFVVRNWTRLPYLCQGDLNQAYYWLHDVVFTLTLAQRH